MASEREKNIQRGKSWATFGLKPYMGDFSEIDLSDEWYCPRCHQRLKLGAGGLYLYCPNDYNICEYEYHNAEGREHYGVFWSEDFHYPLSRSELIRAQIHEKKKTIATVYKRMAESIEYIRTLRADIAELSDELGAFPANVPTNCHKKI